MSGGWMGVSHEVNLTLGAPSPQVMQVITGQHVNGVCIECEQGKHGNCNGMAWDYTVDDATDCVCAKAGHAT